MECDDLNYLNELNIDFGKIIKLEIKQINERNLINYNYDNFFSKLFSLKNLGNNLLYLKITINYNYTEDDKILINQNIFENINNLTLLNHLVLKRIIFANTFKLKLKNLNILDLYLCKNITFEDDSLLNLVELKISDCQIAKSNSLLKLPMVEKCIFRNIPEYNLKNKLIFDFTSFNNIKEFESDEFDFFYLKINNSLNKVRIEESPNFISNEFKKKIFEKLILVKSLNNIHINLSNLNINDI